jgi:hypothetical protein
MPWSDLSKLGADRIVPIARAVHDAALANPEAAYALLPGGAAELAALADAADTAERTEDRAQRLRNGALAATREAIVVAGAGQTSYSDARRAWKVLLDHGSSLASLPPMGADFPPGGRLRKPTLAPALRAIAEVVAGAPEGFARFQVSAEALRALAAEHAAAVDASTAAATDAAAARAAARAALKALHAALDRTVDILRVGLDADGLARLDAIEGRWLPRRPAAPPA